MSAPDRESEAVIGPQRRMLELIYDTFAPIGKWPLFLYVSQLWSDPETDPREIYLDLAERGFVNPVMARTHQFQLKENTNVAVSLEGLMHLREASEDLSQFVSVVRYVAERAGRFRPPSATELARLSITSEEIRLHLELEPGDRALLRLGALISQEAWQLCTSFAGPDSDGWSFEVNLERARRYKSIYTVIDFLDISYPDDRPSVPRPTSSGPPMLGPVRQWLARDKPRMIDYILATLMITVVGGVAVVLLTRGSLSAGSNPTEAASLKSSSTSGARVFLAQGARKGDEYEYAISLDGFPSHSSMMVSCRDGAHPHGFEFFEIATNRTGTASIAATPCYSPEGTDHWVVVNGVGSNHVLWSEPVQPVGGAFDEVTGVLTHTWTNFHTAGGTQGPSIAPNQAITVACAVPGFAVEDGNTWWYRIASAPWDGDYYASADAFYNNGQTSGSLKGTPFVDPRVPKCR